MLSEVTIQSTYGKGKLYRQSAPLSVLQGFAYISELRQIYATEGELNGECVSFVITSDKSYY